jgi:glutaredoxin
MAPYIVYSKPSCPWCVRAKETLSARGFDYEEKIVGEDIDRESLYALCGNPDRLTVPQIFRNGRCIGGYDDLVAHLENELGDFAHDIS